MERELSADQRRAEVRHVLPYLMSLAETGDAEALVTEYEEAKPALSRLRGWGLHAMAQLVVATVCGLRDHVERLFDGPLARLPEPVQRMTRATLRMAEGDVEAGRTELRGVRDELNSANRLIVDRRLRLDPPDVSPALRERARSLLDAPATTPGRSVGRRLVLLVAGSFVAILAVKVWAPWRDVGPTTGDVEPLRYIERMVGTADADAELPLLVLLHGYGAGPEDLEPLLTSLSTPARAVLPAGPYTAGLGRSWFEIDDGDERDAQREASTRRVVAFMKAIADARPTRGRPVLGGFSQGAMLTLSVAAREPDAIAAAFPIGGALFVGVRPSDEPPVHVFHGEVDAVVSLSAAHDAVRRLRAGGRDVTLSTYPGLGHGIDARLAADLVDALNAALAAEAGP